MQESTDGEPMKILVLSDSHSSLRFMRRCIEKISPDYLIHLGDYFDDGETIHEEYPDIPMYQVPGNCDFERCTPFVDRILIQKVDGVKLYMTHGHLHGVKQDATRLIEDAKLVNAQAVLYGHTHVAECRKEDGLWILNPGSSGYGGGSGGVIETRNGEIVNCRLLREADLEGIV